MGVKLNVPVGIAEVGVKLAKRGVHPLIAPGESSVLALNLLETSRVDRSTKFSQDPTVYVGVVFVARLVDQVEVTVDEPGVI